MCLAIPLKLIEIHGNEAIAEAAGFTRPVRVDFIEKPRIGEHVLVHAGFAIERIKEEEAQESLRAWQELLDAKG